jgi:hypothetical protein
MEVRVANVSDCECSRLGSENILERLTSRRAGLREVSEFALTSSSLAGLAGVVSGSRGGNSVVVASRGVGCGESSIGSRGGEKGSLFSCCVHSCIVRASACTVDSLPTASAESGGGEVLFQNLAVQALKSGTWGNGGSGNGPRDGDDSENRRA